MASVQIVRSLGPHLSPGMSTGSNQTPRDMDVILQEPCAQAMLFMDYPPEIVYKTIMLFKKRRRNLDTNELSAEAERLMSQGALPSPQVNSYRNNSLGSDGESEGESLEYVDANSEFTPADPSDNKDLQTDGEVDQPRKQLLEKVHSAMIKSGNVFHEENLKEARLSQKISERKSAASDVIFSDVATSAAAGSPPGGSEKVTSSTAEQLQKLKMLMVENRRLKSRQRCRKCQEKPVGITFLPCGHYSYCYDCGQKFSVCPVCNKTILADVKTFMA